MQSGFYEPGFRPGVGKVAIFCYCQDMRALVRYRQYLRLQISGVLDIASWAYPGGDVGSLEQSGDTGVQFVDSLAQLSRRTDTVIVGSLARYGSDPAPILRYIADQVVAHRLNMYSPLALPHPGLNDQLQESGHRLWCPIGPVAKPERQPERFPYVPVPAIAIMSVPPDATYNEVHMLLHHSLTRQGFPVTSISASGYASLWGALWQLPWEALGGTPLDHVIAFFASRMETICRDLKSKVMLIGLPSDPARVETDQDQRRHISGLSRSMIALAALRVFDVRGYLLASRYGTEPEVIRTVIGFLRGCGLSCLGLAVDSERFVGDSPPRRAGRVTATQMEGYARYLGQAVGITTFSLDLSDSQNRLTEIVSDWCTSVDFCPPPQEDSIGFSCIKR